MRLEKVKYFNSIEIKKILSDELKKKNYNQYLLCLALAYTGARISEVLELQRKDIIELPNSETGGIEYYLKLRTLKRKEKHFRYLPIHDKLQTELFSFVVLKKLKPKDKIFEISRRSAHTWVKKACNFAGIDDDRTHPHTFRHSFGVAVMLKKDIKIRVLQKWLGHASVENTLIYQDVVASDTKEFMKIFDY